MYSSLPPHAAVEPGEGAEHGGSRSHTSRRYAPGHELIQPLTPQVGLFGHENSCFVVKKLTRTCSAPSPDWTGGRASTSATGASKLIFACEQSFGVEERKSEGKGRRSGAEAIVLPGFWEEQNEGSGNGSSNFREKNSNNKAQYFGLLTHWASEPKMCRSES